MNLCKVMQVQSKYMRDNWFSSCGGIVHSKFMRDKKHISGGKYCNILISSDMGKYLKMKKSLNIRIRMNLTWTPSMKILNVKTRHWRGSLFEMRPHPWETANYSYVVQGRHFGTKIVLLFK